MPRGAGDPPAPRGRPAGSGRPRPAHSGEPARGAGEATGAQSERALPARRRPRSDSRTAPGRRRRRSPQSGERHAPLRRRSDRAALVLAAITLVLAVGIAVGYAVLSSRAGSPLRERAAAYAAALRKADGDALMEFVPPSVRERARARAGEAGEALLRNMVAMGASVIELASSQGATIEVKLESVREDGAQGTVQLRTETAYQGERQARIVEQRWVREAGQWYLHGGAEPLPARAPAPAADPTAGPAAAGAPAPAEPEPADEEDSFEE
ncbi:MAG: hypothetical protein KatS3mg102_2758 [Planctomycetota bacterium]|nr:MAG: hypothetical protein KatS3mg102_2758 [Planctomycetota bacterium]